MIRINLKNTELRSDGLRFDAISGTLLAPAKQLQLDPAQPRKQVDPRDLKELRADIDDWRDKGNGLCGSGIMEALKCRWEPGAVKPDGSIKKNSVLFVWDGGRKWRVTHEDYDWLPITLEELSEIEARDAALRTSLQKKLLTPIEEAHTFAQKIKEEGWSNFQCGQFYNVGESYVRNRIGLLNCPPAAQRMVAKHPETMSHALLLGANRPKITADDEKELIEQISQGMTYTALKDEIEERAGNLKQQKDSQRPPDQETQSRAETNKRTGGGNMSRGKEVRGPTANEARQEAEIALGLAAQNIEAAGTWIESLSESDRQKLSGKFAFGLRRRLKEIFPEIP